MHCLASNATMQQDTNAPPVSQKPAVFQHGAPCAGVAAAAVLPVVGVGIAVTQVVRGAVAEPTAISERLRGREWDQVRLLQPTSMGSRPGRQTTIMHAAKAAGCVMTDHHSTFR